jgi:pyruvate-formate lyase-activating enzyme
MSSNYKNSILQSVSLDMDTAKNHPTPEVLRLEVTNGCNDCCLFCGNRKMTRKVGFITEHIVEKALKQAHEMGVRKCSFYTIGEPFLHKELAKFISMAKSCGFDYTFLNTNGGISTQDRLREAVDAGIDSIAFSINAINRKDYKLIHGNDDFEKVIERLTWLNHNKCGRQFNLYVSFVKTRFTSYDENEIREYFKDKCDEIRIQNVQNIGGFLPEIGLMNVDSSDLYFHYEIPCRLIFKSITVTCEGYLTACSVDFQNYLVYADLNICNMQESWNNRAIALLRQRHLANDVSGLLCDNCANCAENEPIPLDRNYASPYRQIDVISSVAAENRIKEWRKQL